MGFVQFGLGKETPILLDCFLCCFTNIYFLDMILQNFTFVSWKFDFLVHLFIVLKITFQLYGSLGGYQVDGLLAGASYYSKRCIYWLLSADPDLLPCQLFNKFRMFFQDSFSMPMSKTLETKI